MISDADAAFYRETGYLVVDAVYAPEEVAAMRDALAGLIDKARGLTSHDDVYDLEPGHTPDHPRVRRIKTPFKADPVFRDMVEHPNLIAILSKIVSPDLRLHGGKINIKAAQYGSPVEWHQDWAFYPHTNDDVLAVGVLLEDATEENGPLMVIPGSHTGPTHDHHVDGCFAGAMDPAACDIDFSKAVALTGKAGACTFHHVRAVHGSAQNRSGRDRPLLLYQVAAADAWDIRGLPSDWEENEERMIAGQSTLTPRIVDCPVRLPYPKAKREGSIYENQTALRNRYFDFDPQAGTAAE